MPASDGSGALTLGEMLHGNDQAARAAAATAAAAKTVTYEPQPIPSTPAEAATRLEQLKADPTWREQFLAGNGAHKTEFHSLTALIGRGDSVDKALAGVPLDGPLQPSKHLTNIGVANALREIGIQDQIIKDVIAGTHKVSRAEYDATQRWKDLQMRDKIFVERYLTNEGDAREKMTLANIILSGGVREEKAA